jgi:tetratricopeptide (TPR) repeat protein
VTIARALQAISAKTNPPLTIADARDSLLATPDKAASIAAAVRSRQAFESKDWRTAYRELWLARKGVAIMMRAAGPQGQLNDARQNTAIPGAGFVDTYRLARLAYEAGSYLEAIQAAELMIRQLKDANVEGMGDFAHRALTIRGSAQFAIGDIGGAERSLAESLDRVQTDPWIAPLGPSLALVKLFLDKGQKEPALRFFARAAAKSPGYRERAFKYEAMIEAGQTPAFGFLELTF